jgi:hypothetical protein
VITLEAIKTQQNKLASMIEDFEAQIHAPRTFDLPASHIVLEPGEHYAGIVLGKNGESNHHLVLLAGEAESVKWNDARVWAQKAGGELPTRREQALLYANLKEEFKEAWYWSAEQHAASSDYAWCQYFDDGCQTSGSITSELRARAVRRLIIE